jgi:hypothetical protein
LRDTEGVFFSNDPFIQYVTGLVYLDAGEIADADVSFRVAVTEYRELTELYGLEVPSLLYCDAAVPARLLGDAVPADSTTRNCPPRSGETYGAFNLFLECGFVAHKQEHNVVLPVFTNDNTSDVDAFAEVLAAREGVPVSSYDNGVKIDYVLKVSMPVLVPTPVPWEYGVVDAVWKAPVSAVGDSSMEDTATPPPGVTARADVVENLDAYSESAFEEAYGKILFRTIVRGLTKYAAKQKVSDENVGAGWLVNWFNVATESADTRAWTTLPEKILLARAFVPEGIYDLRIELYDSLDRHIDTLLIEDVVVNRSRTTYLNHRVF